MEKSKKVRMPAGIRNKLTAAVAMLLVSSIMMVSSTYAWFTLSTAPEVTGITTSVGANGNLEMALLNNTSFDGEKLGTIASGSGDSSAVKAVTEANLTWGNLVDLSDASYGLQYINLQPARLNFAAGSQNTLASITSLLQMPVYGKDGRVAELSSETYSTIFSETGWAFDADNQQYGVRAIGANDNLTPQQAGLISAKAAYTSNLSSAKSTVQGALSANGNALASALTTLSMGSSESLSEEQITAIGKLIEASNSALNYIDAAYKQILLAAAANQLSEVNAYQTAASTINGATTYSEAVDALATLGVTVPDILGGTNGPIAKLNAQKAEVSAAQDLCAGKGTENNTPDYIDALSKLVDTTMITINGFKSSEIKTESGINGSFTSAIINDGGAIVEMPDGSGVFAYIGSVAGNYSANCKADIKYGETIDMQGINATMKTTATVDATVGTALNALQPATSSGDAATVLSDTYGYALDFAFRTNASESYLLLQTKGAQRVYSDSNSAATQGAGSTMTFQVTTTDAGVATLTNEQVVSLMGAIRVAFVNPITNEVYGIAALTDITAGTDGFKGDLYLHNYTVDTTTGVMTLGDKKTTGPADGVDPSAILKLDQSIATAVTVVVWLDGDMVDNSDVANAAQSLVGSMNLQFSSSAELIPMQNTALQNMTITYNELDDPNYKVGLYTFNGTEYALKTGYKLYNGSDNTLYFSNDQTNYTKLTVLNASTAMAPLTVTVTGDASIATVGGTSVLTVSSSAGTIKSVTWTSDKEAVATVADNTNTDVLTDALVTANAVGGATIKAEITVEFTATGASPVTRTQTVEFPMSVASYTVTFDANGGEGTMTPVTGVSGSYTLPTTTTFTRADTETHTYSFGGWATSANGAAITETTITVTENTTLYAVWNETVRTYNVTVPTGVTGAATATATTDYTFTVAEGYTLGTVTVGGSEVTFTTGENGAYTIPGASVTGDIVINVTAPTVEEPSDEGGAG